jgi:hypothetical protein
MSCEGPNTRSIRFSEDQITGHSLDTYFPSQISILLRDGNPKRPFLTGYIEVDNLHIKPLNNGCSQLAGYGYDIQPLIGL